MTSEFLVETNSSCEPPIGNQRHWLTALFCVYFLLGVFGNGILVAFFFKYKKLRDVNNSFVTNMAFSDFLFVAVWVPIKIFEEYHRYRPLGKTACYISIFINYTSQDVSTLSLTAMSYFRYCAVTQPIQTRSKKQRSTYLIPSLCAVTWIIGAAGSIFPAKFCIETKFECFIWKVSMVNAYDESDKHLIFHWVRFVLFYILPLILISFFYGMMAVHLFKDTSVLQRNVSISARRASRSRKKLGVIVLAIVIIFFVSWLPFYVTWIHGLSNNNYFAGWLVNSRVVCMFIPPSLNPIILFITSTGYRRYLFDTCFQCPLFNQKKFGLNRRSTLTSSISLRFTRIGNFTSLSKASQDGGISPDRTEELPKLEQMDGKWE
ncbi:Neuropeptide CCHamide-1 receptor [Holothuria leucospilota]|uniref:Neuropeptide CCHamide-1 receptor n=1 Tax=Holothuria leucospilota TaxID=206669 RepID=A0A9Q1BKI6_HOLLE|nr:Neuropeptide CCHamide-1 receptor [Holothuria leucospilota]